MFLARKSRDVEIPVVAQAVFGFLAGQVEQDGQNVRIRKQVHLRGDVVHPSCYATR